MRAFPALVALDLRATFGWKPLGEYKGLRDWLKLAGAVLLGILLVGDIGFVFVSSALTQYQALKGQGLEGLLLLNGAIMASVAVFFLGFIMILSGWSLSPQETQLFTLPLGDRELLGAKFAVTFLSQAAIGLFLFGTSLAVFGISEAPPPLWWVVGLAVALALPLYALALAWLVLVPLMSVARFIRSRNGILLVSGLVGAGFAVAFNLYVQNSMARLSDPAWILANYAGPGSVLNLMGSTWPPTLFAWKALSAAAAGRWPEALAIGLGLLAGGLATSALAVLLLGGLWKKSVVAFGEGRLRRLEAGTTKAFIERHFRRGPRGLALFLREWRLMNREPRFFLNGPFIVVLMPLILAVMYVAQRDNLSQLQGLFVGPEGRRNAFLAAMSLGAFLGSSTSVAATALSRDAKALPALLALPVSGFAYMMAKLSHALAWAFAGALIGAVSLGLFAGLDAVNIVGAIFASLAFSALANLVGLWIDTAHPRLAWDNPMAALKQNPNSVFVILGSIAALAGLDWLGVALRIGTGGLAALIGGGCGLAFALGLAAYSRFAERKLSVIEPR
ncbi:MAG TPA: hypothetical protein VMV44_13790 [Rectinemataceae bacterium]|nr:hypothetical protein [Rectinemataceae bacterium]